MKKAAFIFITLLFISIYSVGQTADTSTTDTIKNDSVKLIQPITNNKGLNIKEKSDIILIISKNIFWNNYSDTTFRIGVTDMKTKYFLEKYMKNKTIHGRAVSVEIVNNQVSPKVNLIFIPSQKNQYLDIILSKYSGSNTVFVSENFEDRKKVDITILKINRNYKIWINKTITNTKKIFILPELWGYTIL